MCQLLETVRVTNKQFHNISLHNERMNRSRKEIFGCTDFLEIEKLIDFPKNLENFTYKCRVEYSQNIEKVEFIPYFFKNIEHLTLIYSDSIEYSHKFSNRKCFEELLKNVKTDDILIVKKTFLTDTSFSNIAFFDGTKWFTPSTPLLNGTKRKYLIINEIIEETEISVKDLRLFRCAALINAMRDLDEKNVIAIDKIV